MSAQLFTTQDGKTARLVNPYTLLDYSDRYTYTHHKEDDVSRNNRMYKEFESNNPPLPLTTERPDLIGKEFQGEVVWQYQYRGGNGIFWNTVIYPEITNCKTFAEWAAIKHNVHDAATRQALSVPVKGEEKSSPLDILKNIPESELKGLADKFKGTVDGPTVTEYFEAFGSNPKEVYNSAIDDAVKVLENRLSNLYTVKYRPTFYTRFEELKVQINRLKSLKK